MFRRTLRSAHLGILLLSGSTLCCDSVLDPGVPPEPDPSVDSGVPPPPMAGAPNVMPEAGPDVVLSQVCVAGFGEPFDYVFCPILVDYPQAQRLCAGIGFRLVKIESAEENQQINLVMQRWQHNYWIGGTRPADVAVWTWPDGEKFWPIPDAGTADGGNGYPYVNFEPDEPNMQGLEYCAEVRWETGLWNDEDCDVLFTFVCERIPQ